MSRWTEEALVASGEFDVEEVTFKFYYHKNKVQDVKKVCPFCKKVFDKYLLAVGPLVGCRKCAYEKAKKRGIVIAKERLDKIIDGMPDV